MAPSLAVQVPATVLMDRQYFELTGSQKGKRVRRQLSKDTKGDETSTMSINDFEV